MDRETLVNPPNKMFDFAVFLPLLLSMSDSLTLGNWQSEMQKTGSEHDQLLHQGQEVHHILRSFKYHFFYIVARRYRVCLD